MQYKLIAMLAACVAVIAGYFYWQDHQRGLGAEEQRKVDAQAIQTLKDNAARSMALETAKVEAVSKTLRAVVDAQEIQNVKNERTSQETGRKLRDALIGGRLRDPNAESGRSGGCPEGAASPLALNSAGNETSSAGVLPAAPAGLLSREVAPPEGLLSRKFTDLLIEITDQADEINNAYISCREWAESIHDKVNGAATN